MNEDAPTPSAQNSRRFLSTDPSMARVFGDPFRPLEPECRVVQFDQPLALAQLQRAAELMRGRGDVQLYVYGRASHDLEFLRYFPDLRRLHVALYELEDIAGLGHVRESLESFTFGSTKRKFSLRGLEGLARLEALFLVGHQKEFDAVSGLTRLRSLGLSGITLPDLAPLLPLAGLRSLSIFLGGTTNLGMLPRFTELAHLSLMRITKLADLSVLGGLTSLRRLRLDWMRNVTSLPCLARLERLEDVELSTMKGLTDLTPIAAAPNLRRLAIDAMPQLTAENFRCLVGHPHLEELWAYTGKSRVNGAVKRMFPGIAR
jgi:internalin A